MSRHALRPEPQPWAERMVAIVTAAVVLVVGAIVALVVVSSGSATPADTAASVEQPVVPAGSAPAAGLPTADPAPEPSDSPSASKGAKPKKTAAADPGSPLGRKAEGVAKTSYRVREGQRFVQLPDTEFRVSSLNVLGASHTTGKQRGGRFASGSTRMGYVIELLNGNEVDVAGLQELQAPQWSVFDRNAPAWDAYGPQFGREVMANSIVWRTDTWELLEGYTIDVPYFGGNRRGMPYVLLRNLESSQEVWFANFHNPADAHGPAQRWRDAATQIEIDLANRLTADGTPLVFTGDFNDRERYFCPVTANTSLHAANGGSTGTSCAPPDRMDVDWVFGSDKISFTGFYRLTDGLVARTTDHPMIIADAFIPQTF